LQPTAAEVKERLVAQLSGYDRTPFIEQLAEIMLNGPRAADWRKFAIKHPDRWTQSLATMARVAGFSEKTEALNLHLMADITGLSDADLSARLREMNEAIAALSSVANDTQSPIIDISPHTDNDSQHTDNGDKANSVAHATQSLAAPISNSVARTIQSRVKRKPRSKHRRKR
jgi:hypothetical protein